GFLARLGGEGAPPARLRPPLLLPRRPPRRPGAPGGRAEAGAAGPPPRRLPRRGPRHPRLLPRRSADARPLRSPPPPARRRGLRPSAPQPRRPSCRSRPSRLGSPLVIRRRTACARPARAVEGGVGMRRTGALALCILGSLVGCAE